MTATDDKVLILNSTNNKVFFYELDDFARSAADDFTFVNALEDIKYFEGSLYGLSVSGGDGTIKKFNISGVDQNEDITLDVTIPSPKSFAINRNHIFVVSQTGDKIYVTDHKGQRVLNLEDDLQAANTSPLQIEITDNRRYVLDDNDNIYVYGYDILDFSAENIAYSQGAATAMLVRNKKLYVCESSEVSEFNQAFESSDLKIIEDEKVIFGKMIRV